MSFVVSTKDPANSKLRPVTEPQSALCVPDAHGIESKSPVTSTCEQNASPDNGELRPVTESQSAQSVPDGHGKESNGPVNNSREQDVLQIVRGFSFGASNVGQPPSPSL